jgi:hypothetical protein
MLASLEIKPLSQLQDRNGTLLRFRVKDSLLPNFDSMVECELLLIKEFSNSKTSLASYI